MTIIWVGIICALIAAASNNFGIVLQKKVVNQVPPEARDKNFFRTLAKNPIWILGVAMQVGLAAVFQLTAQYYIGPTLVPALQGSGLIILAIGSVKINKETLTPGEMLGIFLLVVATALIGFCELHINISEFDFQQVWFFRNALIFTFIIIGFFILLEICQRKSGAYVKAILLSVTSGFMYAASDFWTSPMVGTIGTVFKLEANWTQWSLFVMACVMLVSSNILAIGKTQTAFKYGPASTLIPIRHVPSLISPIFVYYFIYNMMAPKSYSLGFFLISIVLIIIATFLLGKREEQFAQDEKTIESESMQTSFNQ